MDQRICITIIKRSEKSYSLVHLLDKQTPERLVTGSPNLDYSSLIWKPEYVKPKTYYAEKTLRNPNPQALDVIVL